jgi:hypothetical protein
MWGSYSDVFCEIPTVTSVLWKSHCDECSVKIPLWRVFCENPTVTSVLWKSHCDECCVKIPLWRVLCENPTVTSVVWKSHCDECCVGFPLWRVLCGVPTVTSVMWGSRCDECSVIWGSCAVFQNCTSLGPTTCFSEYRLLRHELLRAAGGGWRDTTRHDTTSLISCNAALCSIDHFRQTVDTTPV